MNNKRRTLRKVNIKERPKSSAKKVFRECSLPRVSIYTCDYLDHTHTAVPPIHPRTNCFVLTVPLVRPAIKSALNLPSLATNTVARQHMSSTYREDYRKCNLQKLRPLAPPIPSTNGSPHSTTHHSYRLPLVTSTLKGFTTRYECNRGVVKEARGIVPTATVDYPMCQTADNSSQYSSEYKHSMIGPSLTTNERLGIIRNGQKVLKIRRRENRKRENLKLPQIN